MPRTRIYDAMRVLEPGGLVGVHHAKPQQFRAVPVAEAVETLRRRYDSRLAALETALERLHDTGTPGAEATHEVWSLLGREGIASRTRQTVDGAEREVVLVVGTETALSDDLFDALADAENRGVTVVGGALDDAVRDRIERAVPDAEVFVSELEWLRGGDAAVEEGVAVGRLPLADGETILVSPLDPGSSTQRAVFGHGFSNGLVSSRGDRWRAGWRATGPASAPRPTPRATRAENAGGEPGGSAPPAATVRPGRWTE